MDLKYEINRLDKDELTYELAFRGITDKKTVDDMRKCLRAILRLEKTGSSLKYPKYPFTFEEDANCITTKIQELLVSIESFTDSEDSALFSKISSKLVHIFRRAERAKSKTDAEHTQRSNFMLEILNLQSQLKSKLKKIKRMSRNLDLPMELTTIMSSTNLSSDSSSSSSDESDVVSKAAPIVACSSNSMKSVPVSKWNVSKFSGENLNLSLNAFLENVDELRISRNVTETQLLNSASELFSGKALIWFRSIRSKIQSWSQLVDELRIQFQPPRFNEKLLKEIKQRTQGFEESIGIYIAVMNNMFNRLTISVTEDVRLKIILPNLAPFYQSQLSLIEITSINQLLTLGRKLEAHKESIESFVPPPRNRSSLMEPDLAYVYTDTERPSTSAGVNELVCWNCKLSGHRSRQCTSSTKNKHCFRCGNPGYTVRSCPKCRNQSGNANRRR